VNHHQFKGVEIPPEGLEVEQVHGTGEISERKIIAVFDDNTAITIIGSVLPFCDLRLPPKKKRIPMSMSTCQKFPWAIRHRGWDEDEYCIVNTTGSKGVSVIECEVSWEALAEDYLDHATGKPLYLEVDDG